ncbi:MAG: alkaline phosphatase D family protein [Acidobacteriota bacterium]|nr:alkaline phosphatase D family protein [Acidobacteriota bacterium]
MVARATARASDAKDWICCMLIDGLKPAREYWCRFTDSEGRGGRIGRTLTAPHDGDTRLVRVAFVFCQNAYVGAQNAYRRMIYEDERAPPQERSGSVLDLSDFIYELVYYPEDRPQAMYGRRICDIVRYTHGEKIDDFLAPTAVDGYRAIYRAYLHDPDVQYARARFPFVAIEDNHELSWWGWQSLQHSLAKRIRLRRVGSRQTKPGSRSIPRVMTPGGSLEQFKPPQVVDAQVALPSSQQPRCPLKVVLATHRSLSVNASSRI